MPAFSPTDASGYVGPPAAANTFAPSFPKWLYHPNPLNNPVIVANWAAELALQTADSRWSETPQTAIQFLSLDQPIVFNAMGYLDTPNPTPLPVLVNDVAAAQNQVPVGAMYFNGTNFVVRMK